MSFKKLWEGLEKPWKLYEKETKGDIKHWMKKCEVLEASVDLEADGYRLYVLTGDTVVQSVDLAATQEEAALAEAGVLLGELIKVGLEVVPDNEIRLQNAFVYDGRLHGLDTQGVLYQWVGRGWKPLSMRKVSATEE